MQLDRPMPVADLRNAHPFDRNSLSAGSSYAACNRVSPADDRKLAEELEARFPGTRLPMHELNPPPFGWGLRLYAVIRKELPFQSVFERSQTPLNFEGTVENRHVISFGYGPSETHHGHSIFPDQVRILDDRGDNDVIVALDTAGPDRDRIILAMIPPGDSLLTTWEVVAGRIRNPNPEHVRTVLNSNETLQIPILDFSLQKYFRELEGCDVQGFPDRAWLELAFVGIRLRLDETGADFLSAVEAGFIGENGDYTLPGQQ